MPPPRSFAGPIAQLLLVGSCSLPPPAPIPYASRGDLAHFSGEWVGSARHLGSGRAVPLTLVIPDGEAALGEVVVAIGLDGTTHRFGDDPFDRGDPTPTLRLLIGAFWIEGGRVEGEAGPSFFPWCGCPVTVRFTGWRSGTNVLEGTLVTTVTDPYGAESVRGGRWIATRRAEDLEQRQPPP